MSDQTRPDSGRMRKLTPKETKAALETLANISMIGDGLKPEIIDWANIGKNAKAMAREVFRPKCKECGK